MYVHDFPNREMNRPNEITETNLASDTSSTEQLLLAVSEIVDRRPNRYGYKLTTIFDACPV